MDFISKSEDFCCWCFSKLGPAQCLNPNSLLQAKIQTSSVFRHSLYKQQQKSANKKSLYFLPISFDFTNHLSFFSIKLTLTFYTKITCLLFCLVLFWKQTSVSKMQHFFSFLLSFSPVCSLRNDNNRFNNCDIFYLLAYIFTYYDWHLTLHTHEIHLR